MKELSIEEKAKAYDEAIERAKDFMNGVVHYALKKGENIMCWVFPELKESEDERIRKDMIFYFQEEIPQCSIQEHADKMRKFISWLKRQEVERTKLELKAGNSYFCYKSRWERADSETFKKGLIYKCNKDGVLDNFVIKNPEQHFIEIKDERIAWLEKQGEQKCDCKYVGCHVNNMKRWCHKKQSEILYEKCNTKCSEYLKQGEQKPTDNEPKFNVGDTIYYNSFGEVKSMIVANVVIDSTNNPMYEDKEGNSVFQNDIVEQKPA